MIKKLVHVIFLPCSKATLLMEKKNGNHISKIESVRLNIHIKMCKWCRVYQKKLEILDSIMKSRKSMKDSFEINASEIEGFKSKIFKKLEI